MRWFIRVLAIAAIGLFCVGLVLQSRLPQLKEKLRQTAQTPSVPPTEDSAADEEMEPPVSAETGLPVPIPASEELANEMGGDVAAGDQPTPAVRPKPLADDATELVATEAGPKGDGASDDTGKTPARTPLGRGFQQLVEQSSEYLGDAKEEASESIERADRMLSDAKSRNADALRQANRQVRRLASSTDMLLFVIEDLACEDLGCYGQTLLATPHIDAIAEDGVRLGRLLSWTQGHPANRWALLCGDLPNDATGKYMSRPSHATLPEMLWQSGYTTALCGDCSWAGVRDSHAGGWDHWWGWEQATPAPTNSTSAGATADAPVPAFSLFPTSVLNDGTVVRIPANAQEASQVPFDQLLVEEIESYLKQPRQGRPMTLVVSLRLSWWKSQAARHPLVEDKPWSDAEKTHATAVMAVDSLVGHVTKLVEASSGPQRTAVMVVGSPTRRKRNETNVFLQALPATEVNVTRAGKSTKLGVAPCVIRWPGQLPPGAVISSACSFHDLMPTLADLTRSQRRPKGLQGLSQLKTWRDP